MPYILSDGNGNSLTDGMGNLLIDGSNSVVRFFSLVNGTLAQQNTQPISPDRTAFGLTGETVWLLGAVEALMLRWGAPFTLTPILSGYVSIYNGSSWLSAIPGVEHMPSAVTWDVSGSVWAVTTENDLYNISVSGVVLSVSGIASNSPGYTGQAAGVPLGLSALRWWTDNHLYAASAFNGYLIQVK